MKGTARYVKVVEWSEEDSAFVGQCAGVSPCSHGDDVIEAWRIICGIVEDGGEIARREGRPLPQTAGTGVAQRIAWFRDSNELLWAK